MDDELFFIEKMRYKALAELEERVEKHIKNEFYNKILPRIIKDVKEKVIIDIYTTNDSFELTIKLKESE